MYGTSDEYVGRCRRREKDREQKGTQQETVLASLRKDLSLAVWAAGAMANLLLP